MIVTQTKGFTKVIGRLDRIHKRLPKAADKDLWNMTQQLGRELRKGMDMAGIDDFYGRLRRSTYPFKQKKYTYRFNFPEYARYLETMPQHSVMVPGKPELMQWAEIRLGTIPFFLTVKPHPFINKAIERQRQKMKGELKNGRVAKAIRSS